MNSDHLIETFNTHRMADWVVRSVATSRERESAEIMEAIRQAVATPDRPPQHLVIYGERGAGKSFLMRMVDIEIERMATAAGEPVVAALLPEEQYNIRSISQLILAVAARIRGADWSRAAFRFDSRSQAQAWEDALAELKVALDERFGAGRGLVVAMVENFDVLVKNLFGSEPVDDRASVGPRALEQAIAEQLLRKLLNTANSRFMLIATATGTVDQNYSRPLFQAFKAIDLSVWSSDDCVAYFNRRRALVGQPELSAPEQARVEAIGRFIGGNPRLAQLLGDVLNSDDAHSIAEVLDGLADHLADYYRRRLDDLSPQAAALLDALIRGGEPRTQSAVAERVGAASQAQIADAFNSLINGRLLAAEAAIGSAGTLYRVRDRLFVHFYRRRYGDPAQSKGLAPIAELLENFFTERERERIARRYLEAGQLADADVVAPRRAAGNLPDAASDRAISDGALNYLFVATQLPSPDWEAAELEMLRSPESAVQRWGRRAHDARSPLERVGALSLEVVALQRRQLRSQAEELISRVAEAAGDDPDARVVALCEVSAFEYAQEREGLGLNALREIVQLAQPLTTPVSRYLAAYAKGYVAFADQRYAEAVLAFAAGTELATSAGLPTSVVRAQLWRARAFVQMGRFDEAARCADAAAENLADGLSDALRLEILTVKAEVQQAQDDLPAALATIRQALASWTARDVGQDEEYNWAVLVHAEILVALDDFEEAEGLFTLLRAKTNARRHRAVWLNATHALGDALIRAGRAAETLAIARDALQHGREAEVVDDVIRMLTLFITAARWAKADDIVERARLLIQLASDGKRDHMVSAWADDIVAAVARASAWTELSRLDEFFRTLVARPVPWRFGKVGLVWADVAEHEGRAKAFAMAARDLPRMVSLMESTPFENAGSDPSSAFTRHVSDLAVGVIRSIDDPDLLSDLAGLFAARFGDMSNWLVKTMSSFALVHRAEDKTRALQQIDPDTATLIRSVLSLPEPKDALSGKGRRKAR